MCQHNIRIVVAIVLSTGVAIFLGNFYQLEALQTNCICNEDKPPVVDKAAPVVDKLPVVDKAAPIVDKLPIVDKAAPVVDKPPVVNKAAPIVDKPPVVNKAAPVVDKPPIVDKAAPIVWVLADDVSRSTYNISVLTMDMLHVKGLRKLYRNVI